MDAILLMMRKLRTDERGATAIEYGLIVALIAVAVITALQGLGGGANGMWTNISSKVDESM